MCVVPGGVVWCGVFSCREKCFVVSLGVSVSVTRFVAVCVHVAVCYLERCSAVQCGYVLCCVESVGLCVVVWCVLFFSVLVCCV